MTNTLQSSSADNLSSLQPPVTSQTMTNAFSQAISMGMSQQSSGMGLYSQSNGMGLNQQGTSMGMNQPGIGNMLNPQQGLGSSSGQGLGMGDLSQTFGEQNQGLPFQGFMPSSQPPPHQVSSLLLLTGDSCFYSQTRLLPPKAPPPVYSSIEYNDDNSCIICYEDMMNSDSVRLECGHRFHTKVLIIMEYLVHNIY